MLTVINIHSNTNLTRMNPKHWRQNCLYVPAMRGYDLTSEPQTLETVNCL